MADAQAFDAHVREIMAAAEGNDIGRDHQVVKSWLRCLKDYKLDPEHKGEARILPDDRLRQHRQEAEDLLTIARFGMEDLYRRVNSMGYVLLLTDNKGVTVDFIGDEKVDRELKRAGLYIGSEWSEENAGTCGVGACLKSGEALTIHQTDHFDMAHTPLSCTTAPIYGLDGNMMGTLDVSLLMSPSEKHSQALTLEVIKSCVRRVELANLLTSRRGDWIIRLSPSYEFSGVDPHAAFSVAADGTISGMTHGAQRLMAEAAGQSWKCPETLMGRPFEDIFDFDFNDLPLLLGAGTPMEQAIETRDGQVVFANVKQPQASPRRCQAAPLPGPLAQIHGGDPTMQRLAEKAAKIVDKQISVILKGETGVGKELIAKAMHAARKRRGPFVAINCAALPKSLIESELFGYAPNAFTGAHARGKKGLIEQANGGTLFLDEIGDMPLVLQARLLRVLAEREVLAVGGTKPAAVDVRVISATHRDLEELVANGQFRQDLFYRLNGVVLTIPPVREREDKDWLVTQLAKLAAPDQNLTFSKEAMMRLKAHSWPGNVREMINALELCAALHEGETIQVEHLPAPITKD